jgi:putative FmdB family regulatory protein
VAIYAFVCRACGEEFDVTRPMSQRAELDRSPPSCPRCGQYEAQRVVSTFTAIKDSRTT